VSNLPYPFDGLDESEVTTEEAAWVITAKAHALTAFHTSQLLPSMAKHAQT
jgi:hypothetical protein